MLLYLVPVPRSAATLSTAFSNRTTTSLFYFYSANRGYDLTWNWIRLRRLATANFHAENGNSAWLGYERNGVYIGGVNWDSYIFTTWFICWLWFKIAMSWKGSGSFFTTTSHTLFSETLQAHLSYDLFSNAKMGWNREMRWNGNEKCATGFLSCCVKHTSAWKDGNT